MNLPLSSHGGQLRRVSEHYGIPASQLLDFSANINPDGPPSGVLTALRTALDDPSALTIYPDLEQTELKQAVATYAGVPPDQVIISNGFVPLLETVLRTLPIGRCLLPVPAFNEYRKVLSRARIEVVPHRLAPESGFRYDIEALLAGDHDAVLLANPQNPSGILCDRESILDLVARAARQKKYILLDEAFIDYMPGQSASRATDRFDNLVVFRSLTKFFAMPGLRVAYAIASSGRAATINRDLPPWPVTSLAAVAMMAALADVRYCERTLRANEDRRSVMAASLGTLGIPTYPSGASFLLLQLPGEERSDALWESLLRRHAMVLRLCSDFEELAGGHLRAGVRTQAENNRLVKAIANVL